MIKDNTSIIVETMKDNKYLNERNMGNVKKDK